MGHCVTLCSVMMHICMLLSKYGAAIFGLVERESRSDEFVSEEKQ